jgi:hypothetical protein
MRRIHQECRIRINPKAGRSSGPDLAPGRSGFILTLFGAVALGFATLLRGAPLLKVLTPVDHAALAGVTSAILATHPNPNDRLYVVNSGPWANLITGLAPPSAYFHRFHLLCDFPGDGLPKLRAVWTPSRATS